MRYQKRQGSMNRRRILSRCCRFDFLERRILFALYGLDDTFGSGGVASAPGDFVIDVLPSGKIFTVGTKPLAPRDIDDARFTTILSRLNSDGTLDSSYGN